MIFEKHANLKYKYGNRHFWRRGYYVDTVGKNTAAIKEYIQNQLKEDLEYDQMSLVEYIDPFTGEPVKKNTRNKLLGAVVGNQSKPASPFWGSAGIRKH